MALPVRDQLRYWGITRAIFLAVPWLRGDVIPPFAPGGTIARFLDSVAGRVRPPGQSIAGAAASFGAAPPSAPPLTHISARMSSTKSAANWARPETPALA